MGRINVADKFLSKGAGSFHFNLRVPLSSCVSFERVARQPESENYFSKGLSRLFTQPRCVRCCVVWGGPLSDTGQGLKRWLLIA
jgi:hypothetical protein